MSSKLTTAVLLGGLLSAPALLHADMQAAKQGEPPAATQPHKAPRRVPKAKKSLPPPLPSGPRGPVPQIPLDAMPAVEPEVTFQDGMLTISAPNSTLGDVLRGVRKQTAADIEVPANANERVAMHLGPAPPREVMADLLNGSRFNYILLGSPQNSNALVRVVLVAKTGPDNPEPPAPTQANAGAPQPQKTEDAAEAVDTVDESADQAATEADETPSDEPGVKTPQQMLQEMQQRQLQIQQQQQQPNGNGQPAPGYPPPGGVMPQRPPIAPQTQPQPQDQ